MPKIEFQPRDVNKNLLPARPATRVDIPGFEGIGFMLHKMDGLWALAEESTGLRVVGGCDTQNHAKDRATYLLGIQGLEKTKAAIAWQLDDLKQKEGANVRTA